MPRGKPVDWDSQPLGELPDVRLAAHLGVSQSAVCAARRSRGIPRYNPPIDWDRVPLGERPDREQAQLLGCSAQSVAVERRRRGIPRYKPPAPQQRISLSLRPATWEYIRGAAHSTGRTLSQVVEDLVSLHRGRL